MLKIVFLSKNCPKNYVFAKIFFSNIFFCRKNIFLPKISLFCFFAAQNCFFCPPIVFCQQLFFVQKDILAQNSSFVSKNYIFAQNCLLPKIVFVCPKIIFFVQKLFLSTIVIFLTKNYIFAKKWYYQVLSDNTNFRCRFFTFNKYIFEFLKWSRC